MSDADHKLLHQQTRHPTVGGASAVAKPSARANTGPRSGLNGVPAHFSPGHRHRAGSLTSLGAMSALEQWPRLRFVPWSPATRQPYDARRRRGLTWTSRAGRSGSICSAIRTDWRFCSACIARQGSASVIWPRLLVARKMLSRRHLGCFGSRAGSVRRALAGQ